MIRRVVRARISLLAVAVMVAPAGCSSAGQPNAPTPTVAANGTAAPSHTAGVDREYQERTFAEKRGITLADAKRRLGWQVVAPDLAERLGGRPYFAGVWIDVHGGDRVKVGVAGQVTAAVAAEINRDARVVGLTEGFDVVPVRFPLSALNEGNDWLGSQLVLVNAGATVSFLAGLRTDLNAIELRTPTDGTLTPKQEALLESAKTTLGDRLVVSAYSGHYVSLACGNSTCGPPLRGGTYISSVENSAEYCTGGFVAKGRVDQKLYLMTAGHCVASHHDVSWATRFSGAGEVVIGPVSKYEESENGDYAILQITDIAFWNPKPWVALWYGPGREFAFNIASDSYSTLGIWVCQSGAATSAASCGQVTRLGVTAMDTVTGVTVKNLGEASYCSTYGDSGAPVFMGHIAYGIESGGIDGTCDSFYQGIKAAEDGADVDVLRTAAIDWPDESSSPTPSASLQIKAAGQ